ncbi:hypothetical protein [Paenibacillus sp. AR247]|uniref:hypothetical protein n=1 Tax=Paenibacillus sp. AR247 TaxID=1631599 RepID=UPI000CF9D602|nr:hypothetical protein [Paenibacillus sp. AR247]PQP85462.1 hypothetical protein CPT76_36255 [Paenibacillus sp. AR247]
MNITAFWDKHYKIEDTDLRVMIAEVVTDELQAAGWTREKLSTPRYRHPMTRRKNYLVKYSLLEILADFIIKADMIAERRKDNPVLNADAEVYREKRKKKREISLDAFLDGGGQVDLTGKVYYPEEENVSNL